MLPSHNEVAKISLGHTIKNDPEILDAITARVSNRNMFSKATIRVSQVRKLDSEDFDNVYSKLITSRKTMDYVANETESAIKKIMSKLSYRQELAEWVRNNATRKKDGMPGFTHSVKLLPSFIAKYGIVYASALGPPAKHSGDLIRNSSLLCVIGYEPDKNNKLSHINAGRKYANMVIKAEMLGISSSALGAAVVDPETREKVTAQLNLKFKPVVILRFGTSKFVSKHSPRWPISEVIS